MPTDNGWFKAVMAAELGTYSTHIGTREGGEKGSYESKDSLHGLAFLFQSAGYCLMEASQFTTAMTQL